MAQSSAGIVGCEGSLNLEVFLDEEAAAEGAARIIAEEANNSVSERGRFVMAVSGGRTPWMMLRALAKKDLPWRRVHVFQVDERVAPAGDADRNLTHLRENLAGGSPLDVRQIYAMPVEAPDLEAAAQRYSAILYATAGSPPVLDLIHLGLGSDGHTASLVPGDPVQGVANKEVALTGLYQGRRRMTLTYPVLNRARRVLWLVTGSEKASILARLEKGDLTIPAGRICRDRAQIVADRAAAETLVARRLK